MAGRIYISGSAPQSWAKKQKSRRRNRKRYRSRRNRSRGRSQNPHRQSRSAWLSWLSSEEDSLGIYNYPDYDMDWLVPATCEPIQSVYFFSGGGSPCHPCSWSSWGLPCCPWSAWAEHGPWEVTPESQAGSPRLRCGCSLTLPGETQGFFLRAGVCGQGLAGSHTPSADLSSRQVLPSQPSHTASGHREPSLPTLHRSVLAGLPSPWPPVGIGACTAGPSTVPSSTTSAHPNKDPLVLSLRLLS